MSIGGVIALWQERAGYCPSCNAPIEINKPVSCPSCQHNLTEQEQLDLVQAATLQFKKSAVAGVLLLCSLAIGFIWFFA
jgi:predicted amidophosphoribosyltransferase